MTESVRVLFAGPSGRTGRATGAALDRMPGLEIVGAVGHQSAGRDLGELWHGERDGREIYADASRAMAALRPDVLCDFTKAEVAEAHLRLALWAGVRPVIGTSGISDAALREAEALCRDRGIPGAVIANFSIVAWLLERVALMALPYFEGAELIELHAASKRDKPSGTARRLKGLLEAQGEQEVPVHSVRLPGLVAHQEVLLGSQGEVLTLRHDALDRSCYAAGLRLCILGLGRAEGLVTDLGRFLPPLS